MNKRGRQNSVGDAKDVPKHTGSSNEVRVFGAEIAVGLQARGWTVSEVAEFFSLTSYKPAERTLERHMAKLKKGEPPLSSEKASGRPTKLSIEQWHVVAGWILSREEKVDLWRVKMWIIANMDVTMDVGTISRRNDDLGLSVRLLSRHPRPQGMKHDEYVIGYFDYVRKLRSEGFFDFDHRRIYCLDSVTNSMRCDREKTISLKGGVQPKLSRHVPVYTNNYLVCVGYESGEDFDTLMFTHDKTFDPNGARWGEVKKWCKKLGLSTDQIFYIKSDRKYCGESKDHIATFKARYRKQLLGCRVMHDGGPAYKLNGEYILEDGADRHEVLPAAQHGQLSPLDNRLNAVAKALWRIDRKNKDFSYDALLLLAKLEAVGQDDITKWWTSNFMIDVAELTLTAVEARIGEIRHKPPIRQHLADMYSDAYEAWSETHVELEPEPLPDGLKDDLDGDFWKK